MATVDSGGVEISYEILNPDSPKVPVFFIAGLGGTRAMFFNQSPVFAADRPVVLHDHRGTGESAKPLGVYSVANMAADIIAIMDDAGIATAHMVGTSTGGAIIQILCLDYADRVQSAAICCSWPKSDAYFLRQFEMRKRVLAEMGTEALTKMTTIALNDPKFFTDHYEQMVENEKVMIATAPPPEVAAERIDAIMAHDEIDRLGAIDVPVIVVGANNDAVTPPYYSVDMAVRIPNAELKLFEDGGHFFFMVHVDEFNTDIADFMARNE
jgi:aminoacrylate hydrolase